MPRNDNRREAATRRRGERTGNGSGPKTPTGNNNRRTRIGREKKTGGGGLTPPPVFVFGCHPRSGGEDVLGDRRGAEQVAGRHGQGRERVVQARPHRAVV